MNKHTIHVKWESPSKPYFFFISPAPHSYSAKTDKQFFFNLPTFFNNVGLNLTY